MKLGPRACALCGPMITPCWACSSKVGHRHLIVVSRHGHQIGSAAACDLHAPPSGVLVSEPAASTSAIARDPGKIVRDRAYRYATSVIRERYRDEFAAVYADVLEAAVKEAA